VFYFHILRFNLHVHLFRLAWIYEAYTICTSPNSWSQKANVFLCGIRALTLTEAQFLHITKAIISDPAVKIADDPVGSVFVTEDKEMIRLHKNGNSNWRNKSPIGRGYFAIRVKVHRFFLSEKIGTRAADKPLARPGRKQATATKLGIYSTHSQRISIHLLARCSNLCHSKRNSEYCPSNQVSAAKMTSASEEKWRPSVVFFSPENRW